MKNIIFYLVLFAIIIAVPANAQTTFEKWIGGDYNWDIGFKIIPAVDGGYIIAASWTIDYGQSWDTETDAALIKVDESGNIAWRTMIPTVARYTTDKLLGVTTTPDGGYIATGIITTANEVGKEDVLVAKFNTSGDTVWTKRYDFAAYDCGNSIIQSGDGGYIIVGRSGPLGNDNILFFKINATGDTLWTRTWGDSYADRLNDIVVTADNNFYAIGCLQPSYVLQRYLIKLNSNGDTLWTKIASGGEAISIRSLSSGGYIVAEKQAITKLDADGNKEWSKEDDVIIGINGGNFRQVIVTSNNEYVVVGKSDDFDISNPFGTANKQLFIAKLNATGDTIWTKRFGKNEFTKDDEGYSIVETSDNGYLAVGFTCLNESAAPTNLKDIYLVKVNSDGITAVEQNSKLKPEAFSLDQNYPNPFNPTTTIIYQTPVNAEITLNVFDMLGRNVITLKNGIVEAGCHFITFNGINYPSGIYYLQMVAHVGDTKPYIKTMKMVLLK